MALTSAEKQKRYRERQKEKDALASKVTTTSADFKRPFWQAWNEELQAYANDFGYYLDEAGVSAPGFEGDQGPEAFSAEAFPKEALDEIFPDLSHGSLRRAEFMVGSLKEAAEMLATAVNAYKRSEIKARLAELEASDLSTVEAKRGALNEAARLNKMLDQLEKQVRITFPQWKVTG
ncbi:hypothetical protein [Albirhodobacter sp. R86504]|uniref:hypothetical protein n=1 Tax=Albirhodobacter sp. R86504 TaxID=3093848 RepID=UPI00366F0B5A